MADGGEIAALFATLGLRVNHGQWQQGNAQIRQAQTALAQVSAGAGTLSKMLGGVGSAAEAVGKKGSGAFSGFGSALATTVQRAGVLGASLGGLFAYLGQRVVRSGVEFNATLEDSKNKVAGLMALAKNTDFNAELANAGMLMEHLERAASKLPGETAQYVEMLSLIAQPVAQAKLGLKELEQLTISATSTALTMHIDPGQAARDIEGALNGVFNSRDRFTGPLLAARGFTGEEGRSRFNALNAKDRAKEVMSAFNAPQLTAMAAAQGKSFSGVLSTMMDAWHQFERMIATPLFEKLGAQIERLNAWFDENKAKIAEVAAQIGGVLVVAFEVVVKAIRFFVEHSDLAISILTAIGLVLAGLAVAWIAGFWPIFLVIAAVTALIYGIRKLMQYPGGVKQAFKDAFDAIVDAVGVAGEAIKDVLVAAFDFVLESTGIQRLIDLYDFFTGKKSDAERKTMHEDHMSPEELRKKYSSEKNLNDPGQYHSSTKDDDDYWKRTHPDGMTQEEAKRRALKIRNGPGTSAEKQEQIEQLLNPGSRPFLAPGASSSSRNVSIGTVAIGDINVHSPNADPVAVGDQVRKVFHEELGNTIRKATDVYG